MQSLDVDWADLELAFRDATGAENYLDRETGEVVSLLEGFADEDEVRESIARYPARFLRIPAIDAGHGRNVMKIFVRDLPPSPMKKKLERTLTGAGALTRALAFLKDDDALLLRYYRFEQATFWRHVESFLEASGVAPASPPPSLELFDDRASGA